MNWHFMQRFLVGRTFTIIMCFQSELAIILACKYTALVDCSSATAAEQNSSIYILDTAETLAATSLDDAVVFCR